MQVSHQDVFNLIVLGLREQQVPAYDEARGVCQYLTDDGRKCAVGILIPGNSGDVFVGDVTILPTAFWKMMNRMGIQSRAHKKLLKSFQHWHDSKWPKNYKSKARRPEPHKFTSTPTQTSLQLWVDAWNVDNEHKLSLTEATQFSLDFEEGLRNAHQD
jgi:hypothetical protein